MLSWFTSKPQDYFTDQEKMLIVNAIHYAETLTSGEVRVFVESKCKYVKAIDRAKEMFGQLNMHQTQQRNGILLYIALKDKQVGIYADEGIYNKVGHNFWQNTLQQLVAEFKLNQYAAGIVQAIQNIGGLLQQHYPYCSDTDTNELPNDIVFGK